MPTYRDSDGDTYDEAEMESYYFEDTANLSDETVLKSRSKTGWQR